MLFRSAGLGLAVLPWYVARESVADGVIVPVLADFALPSQELHAVFPSPKLVPGKVSTFIDFLNLQLVLSREEFDRFLEKKSVWHPKIEGLADSTRAKLARAAYQMLSEAGLISQELVIQPVLLSRELARAIVADDIELLHVYPLADADVPGAGR